MKKIIVSILIVTTLLNIFPPKFVFSYDGTGKTTMEEATIDYDTFKKDSEEGASNVGSEGRKGYTIKNSVLTSIIKMVIKFSSPLVTTVSAVMSVATFEPHETEINNKYGVFFTIQKAVFNKVGLFDINFFNRNSNENTTERIVKDQIAKFYYLMRNIAIVFMLVVLIYTGIRMAISTVATEKATYKKMIVNWVSGFIILMILPYIMIVILEIGEILINLMEKIMESICGPDVYKIEKMLLHAGINSTEKGFAIIIPVVIHFILAFYQVKFFWMYSKRLFSTAFLIVISPLVLVQNILDKVGDNKGSSLNVWLTEFSLNVLIQPLHAAMYMIFMVIALNIIEEAPILAVIFLASLTRGERVLRNILRVKNSATVQSMKDNMTAKDLSSKLGG